MRTSTRLIFFFRESVGSGGPRDGEASLLETVIVSFSLPLSGGVVELPPSCQPGAR